MNNLELSDTKHYLKIYLSLCVTSILLISCRSVNTVQPSKLETTVRAPSSTFQSELSQDIDSSTPTPNPSLTPSPEFPLIDYQELSEGQYIVYCQVDKVSDSGELTFSLFLMDSDGNQAGRLAFDMCHSAISPDGRLIVHRRNLPNDPLNSELIISEIGSEEEYILPNGSNCSKPSWSPDGKWIVSSCSDRNIHAFSIPDGEDVLIVDCNARGGSCSDPLWAPNGTYIAFNYFKEFHPGWGWYLLDPSCIYEDTECIDTDEFAWEGAIPGSWSPDGGSFIFDKGDWSISLIILASHELISFELPEGYHVYSLAWSPDSMYLAIDGQRRNNNNKEIALFYITSGKLSRLSTGGHRPVQFWLDVPLSPNQ